ncbi:copper chaperone PCu(A)C [Meiothermus sp.]|uniref:copper chaperone PCu(A)C n=1 Tax=Meiothermus sp. TaxID=1955249 RepID=UPI0021DCB41F|nr:copper chaperone PCu(A)C [Meiothermus sp.]GIW34963.1 MAG: hypothetical protein KatS3mg072_2296 [Meiothermus sp.]
MRAIATMFFLALGLGWSQQHQGHGHGGHGGAPSRGPLTPIQLRLIEGWIRQVPSSLRDTTVYLTVRNPLGRDLRLVGASSPVAEMVMLMEDYRETRSGQTIQGMREVKSFLLPKNGQLVLQPGGKHLMLMGLKRPLKEGERLPIRLIFEGEQEAALELKVERR